MRSRSSREKMSNERSPRPSASTTIGITEPSDHAATPCG